MVSQYPHEWLMCNLTDIRSGGLFCKNYSSRITSLCSLLESVNMERIPSCEAEMHHYNSILVPYEPYSFLLNASIDSKLFGKKKIFASTGSYIFLALIKSVGSRDDCFYECPALKRDTNGVANIFWVIVSTEGRRTGKLL